MQPERVATRTTRTRTDGDNCGGDSASARRLRRRVDEDQCAGSKAIRSAIFPLFTGTIINWQLDSVCEINCNIFPPAVDERSDKHVEGLMNYNAVNTEAGSPQSCWKKGTPCGPCFSGHMTDEGEVVTQILQIKSFE